PTGRRLELELLCLRGIAGVLLDYGPVGSTGGPGVDALAVRLVRDGVPGRRRRLDDRRRRTGATEPLERVHHELVLRGAVERRREARVGVVVHRVVAEVRVDHLVVLVGPDDRVVAGRPDVALLIADREAGRIDRGQDLDVRVVPQVVLPAVPLTHRRTERRTRVHQRRVRT